MNHDDVENVVEENGDSSESGNSDRPQDRLPPELPWYKTFILWVARIGFVALLLYIGFLWVAAFTAPVLIPVCVCWTYFALFLILMCLIIDRTLLHDLRVHDGRLVDRSEVEGTFVEAESVEKRMTSPDRPENFDTKFQNLENEVFRLKKIKPKAWTEYQILSLNQMIVDFLKVDELIARAKSSLGWLEDYVQDSSLPYDTRQFVRWENSINDATKKIDDEKESKKKDDESETLRAELQEMLGHVADFEASWAKGSAIIRDIIFCGWAAIVILIIVGLLPFIYKESNDAITILSWMVFGASGALTAVLMHLYKSNKVEVGNTEGRGELIKTFLSVILGIVAGLILYSIRSSGLVSEGFGIPGLNLLDKKDLGLTIILSFGAGFYFEGLFNRFGRLFVSE
ncbi:MAG: hypothetical protein IID61_18615 [SAR324 cluster bacterium]|nr:hypothetical protein [SAR324 cluster bacterium]